MQGKILSCLYQDGIHIKKSDISELFPAVFEERQDLNLLQIVADNEDDFIEVIRNCPLNIATWLSFITKHNVPLDLPIKIEEIKLSWLDKFSLHTLGPVGNDYNHLYSIKGELLSIVQNSIDYGLWGEGVAVVLPIPRGIQDILKHAVKVQLNKDFAKIIDVIFSCVLISNHDGSGGSFIWRKDWVYADVIDSWASSLANLLPTS